MIHTGLKRSVFLEENVTAEKFTVLNVKNAEKPFPPRPTRLIIVSTNPGLITKSTIFFARGFRKEEPVFY